MEGVRTLTFDSDTANQMECAPLVIIADGESEGPETLTVQLTSALAIDPARNSTTVTILDHREFCDYVQ